MSKLVLSKCQLMTLLFVWFQRDASWPRPWRRENSQPVLPYGGQAARSGPHQGPVWPATRGEFEKKQFARLADCSIPRSPTHACCSDCWDAIRPCSGVLGGQPLSTSYARIFNIYLISIYVDCACKRLSRRASIKAALTFGIHNANKAAAIVMSHVTRFASRVYWIDSTKTSYARSNFVYGLPAITRHFLVLFGFAAFYVTLGHRPF
jgi:hypothetical protein